MKRFLVPCLTDDRDSRRIGFSMFVSRETARNASGLSGGGGGGEGFPVLFRRRRTRAVVCVRACAMDRSRARDRRVLAEPNSVHREHKFLSRCIDSHGTHDHDDTDLDGSRTILRFIFYCVSRKRPVYIDISMMDRCLPLFEDGDRLFPNAAKDDRREKDSVESGRNNYDGSK